jgi:hypothetical protein
MNATKSREVIWGGRIMAAKISAERARKRAVEAVREADRAEARGGGAWGGVVPADGRLWRAGAALPGHRLVSKRRIPLP